MSIAPVVIKNTQTAAVSATDVTVNPFGTSGSMVSNVPTSYSLQVSLTDAAEANLVSTGGAAWDVFFEGSLDAIGWTTIIEHVNGTNANGATVSQATTSPNKQPFLFFRIRIHLYTKGNSDHMKFTAVGAI